MTTLKDRLKEALSSAGLNKSQLAAKVGVSRASVSDWFTGATQTIEGTNLVEAANALGVDPRWLATGKGLRSATPGDPLRAEEPHATYDAKIKTGDQLSAGSDAEKLLVLIQTFLDTDALGRKQLLKAATSVSKAHGAIPAQSRRAKHG